jgi:hypothetical protein
MDRTPATATSASTKAMIILASLGLQGLCYGVFATLLAVIPLPFPFLYAHVSEVSVVSPRAVLAYLATVVAAAFAGWSVLRKGWFYGLIVGACAHLASIGPSSVSLARLWINLHHNPDIIYQAPGNPPLGVPEQWLIVVVMPAVAAAGLGAAGGLVGQWLRSRRELRSGGDSSASRTGEA